VPVVEGLTDEEMEAIPAEPYHVVCCNEPLFYCGCTFHEELMAPPGSEPEECCDICMQIFVNHLCPPPHPTHAHCPFTGAMCTPVVGFSVIIALG
jgi:hypothetical protein